MPLMASSEWFGTRQMSGMTIQFNSPDGQGDVEIEYSADQVLLLMCKIQTICRAYGYTTDNSMDLLLKIHSCRKGALLWHGSKDLFSDWQNVETMVSKLLAAVLTERETIPEGCNSARLVLTERSFAQFNPVTGGGMMVLEYVASTDSTAEPLAQPVLRVEISSRGRGLPKEFHFKPDNERIARRYVLSVW